MFCYEHAQLHYLSVNMHGPCFFESFVVSATSEQASNF